MYVFASSSKQDSPIRLLKNLQSIFVTRKMLMLKFCFSDVHYVSSAFRSQSCVGCSVYLYTFIYIISCLNVKCVVVFACVSCHNCTQFQWSSYSITLTLTLIFMELFSKIITISFTPQQVSVSQTVWPVYICGDLTACCSWINELSKIL